MKIAVITFHWAANYGAVLQAYALQHYLSKIGIESVVLDYYPARFRKRLFKCFMAKSVKKVVQNIAEYKKQKKLEQFRSRYLVQTRYYSSNKKLRRYAGGFDCYICGSDQIWNESFTRNGEGKKTFTYFLDFVPGSVIKCSYAASFGALSYDAVLKKDIKKYLQDFELISVREASGAALIKSLGIEQCEIVPDPTMLLRREDYEALVESRIQSARKYAFSYMLHGRDKDAEQAVHMALEKGLEIAVCTDGGMETWLGNIFYADFVITNSFHGTVMAILFHRPFIVFLIDGSGMNDRMITLLTELGLEKHVMSPCECPPSLDVYTAVDWGTVDARIAAYRKTGQVFIEKIIQKTRRNMGAK